MFSHCCNSHPTPLSEEGHQTLLNSKKPRFPGQEVVAVHREDNALPASFSKILNSLRILMLGRVLEVGEEKEKEGHQGSNLLSCCSAMASL